MTRPSWRAWWAMDTRFIELMAALCALWWSSILWLPLDAFVEAPSLRVMREFAPERFWAGMLSLQGGGQLLGLSIDPHPLRCFCALTAAVIWLIVAALMLLTEPPLPSGGVYLLLALGCVWVVARGPCDGD